MAKCIKKRIRSLDYFELAIIEIALCNLDKHLFETQSDFVRYLKLTNYITDFREKFRETISKNIVFK